MTSRPAPAGGVFRRALLVAFALVLASAVTLVGTPDARARAAGVVTWDHKGFSLPVWSENELFNSGPALEQLAGTGANTVTFVVSWYTPNRLSTEMYRTGNTASDASLTWAIAKARSLGMKVDVKLHLEPQDGLWRAYIDPTDVDGWFRNYGALVGHYADLGRVHGIATIVIGAELISMSANPGYAARWRALVAGVRQRFPGKLTYSANWGTGDFAEEYPRITWWDALDYLGISAYFELATTATPTVDQLKASWSTWRSTKIAPFQQRWNKPVLFTEIGYRSADGTAMRPWNSWDLWPLDLQEQADCYEAVFAAWADVPWFAGASFWAWNANTNVSPTDIWYEVQGKPAKNTIASWFGATSAPPPAAPTIQIRSPQSNQQYSGAITVQASATNVTSVSYRINENAGVPLAFDAGSGLWRGQLDTRTLANGYYNVTVTGQGQNGSTVEDRAWSIQVNNTGATPTPAPTATPTASPSSTPSPSQTPTPAPTASPTSAPAAPTIQIRNPQSNQVYSGTIAVQASATSVNAVTYRINENAGVPLVFDAASGLWRGQLDTRTLANGYYNVTVTGQGQNGSSVEDRAWFIQINNSTATPAPTATPSPSVAPSPSPTAAPSQTPSPTRTPSPSPSPTAAPAAPTIQIRSPLSNQVYSGAIAVQASATSVSSVSYRINENTGVPLVFDAGSGLWRGQLDTRTLANGWYNVTVTGHGLNGSSVEDRAWFIEVRN